VERESADLGRFLHGFRVRLGHEFNVLAWSFNMFEISLVLFIRGLCYVVHGWFCACLCLLFSSSFLGMYLLHVSLSIHPHPPT
jgi:hypothetical protein